MTSLLDYNSNDAGDFEEQDVFLSNSQITNIEKERSDYFQHVTLDKNGDRHSVFYVLKVDEFAQKLKLNVGDFIDIPQTTNHTKLTKRPISLRRPSSRVLQILRRIRSYQERYCIWKPTAAEETIIDVTYNLVEKLRKEILPKSPEWIKNHDNANNDWTYLATRTRLLHCMTDHLPDYEGSNKWLSSPVRFMETRNRCINNTILPFLRNLHNVKGNDSENDKKLSLHEFCNNIWNRFCIDFSNYFQNGSYHFILHSLTPMYMSVIVKKLHEKAMVPAIIVPGKNGAKKKYKITDSLLEKQVSCLCSSVLARCPPSKLPGVVDTLKKYIEQTDWCNTHYSEIYGGNCILVSLDLVSEWLYDLEQASLFLTRINELNIVRVSLSKIEQDNVSNTSEALPTVPKKSVNLNDELFDAEISSNADSETHDTQESTQKKEESASDQDLKYSKSKLEGSRVYAEYSNGGYYWGLVAHVNHKKQKYLIHFEDGDILDNIPDSKIFTEAQYKKLFEEDPPPPVKPSKSVLSRNERRGRRVMSSYCENNHIDQIRSTSTATNEPKKKKARRSRGKDHNSAQTVHTVQPDEVSSTPIISSPEVQERIRLSCCSHLYAKSAFNLSTFKCGHCLHCKKGNKYCLQTVCIHMREPATGFPTSWTYHWSMESKKQPLHSGNFLACRMVIKSYRQGSEFFSPLRSIVLVSPNGKEFHDIDEAARVAARDCKSKSAKIIVSTFLTHTGLDESLEKKHSFLKGKKYCHDWTDVQGKNHVVFGKIVDLVKDSTSIGPILFKWYSNFCFKVQYSEVSLQLNNNGKEEIQIPGIDYITNDLAWGGCVQYERKRRNQVPRIVHRNIDRTMPCKSWIVPEMRKEDICENGLPRLIIVVRGFQLVFSVKKHAKKGSASEKDNYSVVCKCKCITDEDDPSFFDLQAGELLDLGVCAPFLASDRKHFSVWNVKNYIFEEKCEEWCFMTENENYCYDLTNDSTGIIHEQAKSHLLSYINECPIEEKGKQLACIHTEMDPAGHVHYLLGVAFRGIWNEYEEGMKKFNLSSGCEEVPIFADFGPLYENVRLKKQPSQPQKSSPERDAKKLKFLKELIGQYDYNQLFLILDYLSKSFLGTSNTDLDNHVKKRTQRVVCILNERMEALKKESSRNDSEWEKMFQTIDYISQLL